MLWQNRCNVHLESLCIQSQCILRARTHLKLLYGNVIIGFVESVRNVPSDVPELPPFLHDGVEKRDAVQEFRERPLFARTPFEKELISYGIRLIVSEHVGLQARRRLVGHFDAVLKHRDRELTWQNMLNVKWCNALRNLCLTSLYIQWNSRCDEIFYETMTFSLKKRPSGELILCNFIATNIKIKLFPYQKPT